MKRVVTLICQLIGAPKPVNIKRKFLIKNGAGIVLPGKYEQFESEQTYLLGQDKKDEAGFTFIRRRGQNGSYHYTYSMSRDVPDHGDETVQKTILERQISGREFIALQKVINFPNCLNLVASRSNSSGCSKKSEMFCLQ